MAFTICRNYELDKLSLKIIKYHAFKRSSVTLGYVINCYQDQQRTYTYISFTEQGHKFRLPRPPTLETGFSFVALVVLELAL